MSFVLDASITLAWCFKDEETPLSIALLDRLQTEAAYVPGLWTLEIGNILLSACKKQRITYARATEFLHLLGDLAINIDDNTAAHALHDTFLLAYSEQLTTYDAAYLELAIRLGLPLATKDVQLSKAASKMGVALL